MTGDKIAVIDLGSNTFHLLICEVGKDGSWSEVHKEREYVKLASAGIDTINANAEQRAIDAMTRFAYLIKQHDVIRTLALGTAALREARNGDEVVQKLSSITGIPIEIIDGDDEAGYILEGIRSVIPVLDAPGLIMDIGGGSVEFILFQGQDVAYSRSFKIGVAVLFTRFHKSDPISREELSAIENFLNTQLDPLFAFLKSINSYYLIGASGSFEVLFDALPKKQTSTHWAELDMHGLINYLDEVISANYATRKTMPEIPEERLDYIVVACALIRFFMLKMPPEKLYYCEYALKEGAVAALINNLD